MGEGHVQQQADVPVSQPVERQPPAAADRDDPVGPEQPKGVADAGLALAHDGRQVVHADLPCLEQGYQQRNPTRVAEQPEHIGELAEGLL